MRVMSFNVRGAYWEQDGVNYWPERAELNVATILRHQPDLIGFQELQDGNMAVYEQTLTRYSWSRGPHYGNRAPFEYPAIAWDAARMRLSAVGGFWLSCTPLQHSGDWETACVRSAQWARFQPASGEASFVFLNTHLDHVSEQARIEGARLIVAQLAELAAPGEPVAIVGDFNCDPGTPAYQVFIEAGYADSFRTVGGVEGREALTYHGFRGREYRQPAGRSERIDWILTRGFGVQSYAILDDADPPRYPSDHYPVLAELGT
jgi:endonuclease/exonuclease/phosphatase family metal-dependent hydrolase